MPAAWQALTAPQRQAWIDLFLANTVPNKLGEAIHLSGFNGYSRTNTLRLLAAQTLLATAPTTIPSTVLTQPSALVLDVSASTLAANVTNTDPWAVTTGGFLYVFITTGQNPTRLSPTGGYTFWAVVAGNTGTPPATLTLSTPPIAIVLGRQYFVRFRAMDSVGRVSAESIVRVAATP